MLANVSTEKSAAPHPLQRFISCAAPFNFSYSQEFLRGFSPMVGDQVVSETEITKALMVRGQPIAFTVSSVGTVENPRLQYRLSSNQEISVEVERTVADRISWFLSADEDLKPFYELAQQDPAFAPLAQRLRGLHHVKFLTPFETACWGVINQRIQLPVARRMKESIAQAVGGRVVIDGASHWAFPEADAVARVGEKSLGALIKSERKAKAIAALAEAFREVDENFLRRGPLEEVEAWLRRIHGVGTFTSAFVMYRGLGRFLKQPLSPKLLGAATHVYGYPLSDAEMLRLSQRYGPWAGHWALYLWSSRWF